MALRLPPQAPRRQHSYSTSQPPQPPTLEAPPRLSQLPDNESTEWVLFSPSQPSADARTHTTSTERTPRTVAPSRLSDFGSFGTPTRSAWGPDNDDADEPLEESLDEDGTELDSLDDGLHAFRAPSLNEDPSAKWDQGTPAVLPAHDGLGSFEASAQPVQDQLWQHEQYNPHRRPTLGSRRFSNVQRQLDSVEDHEAPDMDRERWQRIEKWRMDQSRVLLQEIERETRKRRHSRASRLGDPVGSQTGVAGIDRTLEMSREDASPPSTVSEGDANEPLWRKITRKVIRDLIGIDDSLLFALFGDSLSENERGASAGTDDALRMNETLNSELDSVPDDHSNWQTKLLQRIAHELGILVNQLCEHPGAFTSYLSLSDDIPNQYAGMPLGPLPEESDAQAQSVSAAPTASQVPTSNADSVLSPQFSPTLRDPTGREHAAQWGIEDDDLNRDSPADSLPESVRLQQEKEYWERELDVMMVFRYLRNRFSRRGSNADAYQPPARRPPQDASRRAAIIRQHHPLVARAHSRSQAQVRRQSQHSANQPGPAGISSPLLRQHFRRPSSSCGQSAKLSAISSRRTLTGSSRNYWDIGGSVDSGSAIAPVGGVGSWGDV
ncbi:hypothetical protein ANOM_002258 [Aspergillus nomiae NRRL 13137]|uniref:Uncharacterized protein n=1 Tax=Aspergillus nomiae NRRL (strain ATCC 15546 / NRRL 13137 / CBS 260.88 / M93) TaxID=1509407 RepID=A0A0L1JCJ3_ASPN3|nr:uncharacterized protein ANOM_002258 [Aspergillus nomiae NRRL 13137]KNG89474.1 hypothetical protein ANOM_002258 [Aspergillus nomiae NRRL 13137]